jgi:UDP-2,4-diacetamido-2,4,6-trideoxy-beta-L-altropyranose hydrolase
MRSPGTLLIRADASATIGNGHVMRCLALAQGWQDSGGQAVLAAAELPGALEKRLLAEEIEVARLQAVAGSGQDAAALARLALQRKAAWVVLDGERFGSAYAGALKQQGLKILWLDDFGSARVPEADLILNQNLGISSDAYAWCRDDARLLLGTEYVSLRREFRQAKPKATVADVARRMLVTFGGSDPDCLTERVLQAIAENPAGVEVTAVVGSSNPRLPDLRRLAGSLGVTLLSDPANVPELMVNSDLAVVCAGGTLWELLYCGCAVLSYSRNSVQASVIAQLAEAGAVVDLGPVAAFAPAKLCAAIGQVGQSVVMREKMRAAGRRTVDGHGVRRVIRALNGE